MSLRFLGLGHGTASSREPPRQRTAATPARDAAKPNLRAPSAPLVARIRVSHARRLSNQDTVRRDSLIANLSDLRFACQLNQSPDVGAWVSFGVPNPVPLVDRVELGTALMAAVRRDLPALFDSG